MVYRICLHQVSDSSSSIHHVSERDGMRCWLTKGDNSCITREDTTCQDISTSPGTLYPRIDWSSVVSGRGFLGLPQKGISVTTRHKSAVGAQCHSSCRCVEDVWGSYLNQLHQVSMLNLWGSTYRIFWWGSIRFSHLLSSKTRRSQSVISSV